MAPEEAGPHTHALAIYVALGTRGDVQPPLLLAQAQAEQHREGRREAVFLTHAAHQGWVTALLPATSSVRLHWLDTPPAQALPPNQDQEEAGDAAARSAFLDGHLQTVVRTIQGVLSSGPQQQPRARALLVHNLFALEAFHIAEALGAPSLAVSPCVPPYAPPPGFARRFEARWPKLYEALQSPPAGAVSWRDVEHWLWPLFSERWSAFRQQVLGLREVPYLAAVEAGAPLPPAPRLLYAVSPHLLPRPGHWPPAVQLTGFVLPPPRTAAGAAAEEQASQEQLLHELDSRRQALGPGQRDSGVLCVDFGSSLGMGVLPDAREFLRALCAALEELGMLGVVLTGGSSSKGMQQAWEALQLQQQQDSSSDSGGDGREDVRGAGRLVLHATHVDHASLLPRCAALLHAGAAGTLAAALAAGRPQILCPLHFDQFTWADRLTWLGLATRVEAGAFAAGAPGGFAEAVQKLVAAVRGAMSPEMQQAVAQARDAVLREDGLAAALAELERELEKSAASGDGLRALPPLEEPSGGPDSKRSAAQPATQPGKEGQKEGQRVFDAAAMEAEMTKALEKLPVVVHGPDEHGFPVYEVGFGPELAPVLCHDASEGLFIYREVFRDGCYGSHGVRIHEGDTVLDVGANVGFFSLWAAHGHGGGKPGRIVAVEPMPPTLGLLKRNTAGLTVPIDYVDSALLAAPTAEALTATFFPHMPGNSTLWLEEKEALQKAAMSAYRFADTKTFQCRVTTLSDVVDALGLERLDFLKVDVEGSELEVLLGIQPRHWPLIQHIVVEVADVDGRARRVQDLFRQQGFAKVTADYSEFFCNVMVYASRA